ncbi:hypothetical protein KR767_04220 [Luteibacter anthropi]|uniref:hypothetical protein n=1 Tax=Luteibacter anthropi TaxID=564369 RepID=UPI002032876B|nr:hypothetical protein [Luteibacter anthropi]URX63283.1 hypothetical protein KR767_04220 [Luteibacter anthropi]
MAASTPHQRLYIRCLLAELGIATLFVSEPLLPYAGAAGLPELTVGQRLDEVLRHLDSNQARALTKALVATEVPA